jgi:hypothetical protein
MIGEAFFNWLTHLSHYKYSGSCLLVFDWATSHLDHSTVEAADCHDVTLLCLPIQTTHELQLMDRSIFGPFERYWDEQVLLFCSHITDRTTTKQRSGKIFTEACDKAAHQPTLKHDFVPMDAFPSIPRLFLTKHLLPVL